MSAEEKRLQDAAHKAVTDFVNAQNCQTKADVSFALGELARMTAKAMWLVNHGKSEKLS